MTRDKTDYDVIVIGSGLAGLTAANKLGMSGLRVLLLEQHSQLGGLAAWFARKGHIFDVSLHGFPVGMKKTCRKYWSSEIAERIVQLPDIRFDNPQFSLKTSFDMVDFMRLMQEKFKIDTANVKAFFDEVSGMNYYDDQSMKTRELFAKHFPGRTDVWRLLMEPITYANGSTLDEPAITYGIVFSNFMSKGVYTFEGGTDLFIKMLRECLVRNKVEIRTSAKVDKIIIGGARSGACGATGTTGGTCGTRATPEVKGVVVNGETLSARAVISNGNIVKTVFELAGESNFRPEFVEKAREVRINNSSCQVYIGIREGDALENIGDLIFTSTAPEFDTKMMLARKITSRTYSIYYPKTRPGRERYTIVSSTNANYNDWAGLSQDEYRKSKQDLIEDTLNALEKYVPDIRRKADYFEAATPRTFERYTLHTAGSSFGTKFEGLPISMGLSEQVKGLYHTGSVGIIMSGWLGAANYGVITANNVEKSLF
jgi:all-trans-retinol 13,14-reductase